MNVVLWIVQVLLAAAFFMAGAMKLTAPMDVLLANGMTFVEIMPAVLVRFIGLSEVAGAVGLVLPAALRVLPRLTPLAGFLLSVVMVLAIATHLAMGEPAAVPAPLVLGLLSLFVAWGRTNARVIEPRGTLSPA